MDKSRFWATQPVGIASGLHNSRPGQICSSQTVKDVDKNLTTLPPGLQWRNILPHDSTMIKQIIQFLEQNYVTDSEETIRLGYSEEFMKYFLSDALKDAYPVPWSVAIVDKNAESADYSEDVVGFISAVPRTVLLTRSDTREIAEVNFLCVREDDRGRKLTPLLIKEITRRVNLAGIFTAIFTSGTRLPQNPFCSVRYYHKFLDVDKLNQVGFTNFPEEHVAEAKKLYQHKNVKPRIGPNMTRFHVLRGMTESDIPLAAKLFESERMLFSVVEIIDETKLQNMQQNPDLQCFIVEEVDVIGKKRTMVGFVSVFTSVLITKNTQNKWDNKLTNCYIHYICGVVSPIINRLFTLLRKQGCSLVSCTTNAQNMAMIQQESMTPGTGELYYYMYNYRLPVLPAHEVAYHVF